MSESVTVIEIITQVTDATASGAASATQNVSKLEKAMQKVRAEADRLKKMSKLEIAMYAIDKASKGIDAVMRKGRQIAGKVWSVTVSVIDKATAPIRGIMRILTNPIVAMAGIAGIGLGIGDLVGTYKNFEQGMANVKAIIRGTNADMAALSATAKGLGESTMFSAQQVAEGMEFLAMAGWKTADITAGMSGLLDLAAAGAVDVATAADVVSSTLAQFNMSAGEAGRVADVLAAIATNSKTNVHGLGESLKYAGSQAGALGYTIEDTALALGLMGDRGIDASSAGTALRTTLARMAKEGELTGDEAKGVAAEMNKLGVELTNSAGKTKPLITVMRDLRKGFAKLSQTEKAETAAKLAGMYAQSGLLAIVNTSEEKFNSLADAIANSTGAAREMANTRMNTLQGSMLYLQSAAEGVKLAFMERLAPYLKQFIDWLTGRMPGIKKAAMGLADSMGKTIDRIMGAVKSMINSPEWQNAKTLWDKVKVAWDEVIAKPFLEWWESKGKALFAKVAEGIGKGIGGAIKFGISALFGMADDGLSIGSSFARGFAEGMKGIEWGKVVSGLTSALVVAIKEAIKLAFSLALSSPVTATIATAWLGGKAIRAGVGGYKMWKGGKAALGKIGAMTGISQGRAIAQAAQSGGMHAQSVLAMAQSGQLGLGTEIGTMGFSKGLRTWLKAAKNVGKVGKLVKGLPVLGALLSVAGSASAVASAPKEERGGVVAREAGSLAGGFAGSIAGMKAGAVIGGGIGALFGGAGAVPGAVIGGIIGGIGGGFIGSSAGEAIGGSIHGVASAPAKNRRIRQEQEYYSSETLKKAVEALANKQITAEQFMSIKQTEIAENLEKRFGTVELSMSEIQHVAEKITFKNMEKEMTSFSEASVKAEDSLLRLNAAAGELEKLNWKAKIGLGFDKKEYKVGVDAFIAETKKYIASRRHEITEATKLLMPGDMAGLDTAFSRLQSDIDNLSSQLTAKFKIEGELDTEGIADIQKQIAEELKILTDAELEGNLEMLKIRFGDGGLSLESFNSLQSELEKTLQAAQEGAAKKHNAGVHGQYVELKTGVINESEYKDRLSKLNEAYKAELSATEQRISKFLTEGIGEKFGLTAEQLTKGMQSSMQNGFNPATWTGRQVEAFLGIRSLEDGAKSELALMVNRLAATLPNLWSGQEDKDLQRMWQAENGTGRLTSRQARSIRARKRRKAGQGLSDQTLDGTDGVKPYASGGIMTRPHMGLVAEDGAEAIIPLSGKRRSRGLELWEKAGQILGVKPYAEGGIIGGSTTAVASGGNGGGMVPVNIGNVTFSVSIESGNATDTESIVRVLKDNIKNLTDEIAHNLALSLQQVLANMPVAYVR